MTNTTGGYMFLFVGLLVIIAIGLLIAIIAGMYNKLVTLRNRYKNAFAQIDVQLKRRYDLIPNLVETAKKYMKHESETLENVVKARNAASTACQQAVANPGDPAAMKTLLGAEGTLSQMMGKLQVTFEQYPDLKANQTMAQLMEELTSTENKVSFARQSYNDSVMTYNTSCQTFPTVILAGMFGFQEAALFEVSTPAEREAVKVQF
jgi:LemA protein